MSQHLSLYRAIKPPKNETSKQIKNIRVAQRFALSPNMQMIVGSIPALLN